ncbi:cobalt-precorrin-5B (C(1))-methyltransferase CbiD [Intestinibacillus massiliensis]|uniref:cobalt-precorrin-5B (C(1))-methyltransferase CbiD n=1 Tax=Intestinibacillus massiliensis TaxID=1871029 RepID=UPI000B350A31|nr:cobalt-precorrin-5B (C(1))-methyltransferase CbiD [Intestinibacillus massiliensis]
MEVFLVKNQKGLRCGYTTGSCAAAAAGAAAQLLLSGAAPQTVHLLTPKGIVADIKVVQARLQDGAAVCTVRKDSGDDPDVTDGIEIWASVTCIQEGFLITGGAGVGRVTRPGLACKVGAAAINPAPREQILRLLRETAEKHGYAGGLHAVIGAKNGEEVAKATFNGRLGIVGGISILGTSGIVEPMSEQALTDTIHVELDSRWAAGERDLLACPGNYGRDFARSCLGINLDAAVTTSNYIGETLDYAIYKGFHSLLFIGHAGKLVKLAAGVMQTHSSMADGRQEIFAAHAALHGASRDTVRRLMGSITVDECIGILRDAAILQPVLQSIAYKIEEHLEKRTRGALRTEFIIFTNASGELLRSEGAAELLKRFQEKGI